MWYFCPRCSTPTPAACLCPSPHPTSDLEQLQLFISPPPVDVLMAQGSITLSELRADGQPHPVAIKMKRWCGANAGQPAGELAVELRLRPRSRGGSRRGGLAHCPSGAGSEAGLLSRSGSGSSRGGSCGSGSLSYSASLPREDTRRLGRWAAGSGARLCAPVRDAGWAGCLLSSSTTAVQSDPPAPPAPCATHPVQAAPAPPAGRASTGVCLHRSGPHVTLRRSRRVPPPKSPP